ITEWANQDAACREVANALLSVVEELDKKSEGAFGDNRAGHEQSVNIVNVEPSPPLSVPSFTTNRTWKPENSLEHVNRRFAWRHVPYLLMTLMVSMVSPWLFSLSGHAGAATASVVASLRDANGYCFLGIALLGLAIAGPLDHQFVLSIVRSLLFLGIFSILCG